MNSNLLRFAVNQASLISITNYHFKNISSFLDVMNEGKPLQHRLNHRVHEKWAKVSHCMHNRIVIDELVTWSWKWSSRVWCISNKMRCIQFSIIIIHCRSAVQNFNIHQCNEYMMLQALTIKTIFNAHAQISLSSQRIIASSRNDSWWK